MSPAEDGIKKLYIYTAWFFKEEAAVWFEHPCNFVDCFAPVGNVMQNTERITEILRIIFKRDFVDSG